MKEIQETRLIAYFDAQVLAAYRSEPDKYIIETDNFHGTISVTDAYFRQLESEGRTNENIHVRFGYRTLQTGEVAIAAFAPDLVDRSGTHVKRWMAFHLPDPLWTKANDDRFEFWVRRYLEGDWSVENGPLSQLRNAVDTVNAITSETVGLPLFMDGMSELIPYPSAENTHRYEDAHAELYRYLIDGLDKECIARIAQRLGRPVNVKSDKTMQALRKALPQLTGLSEFNAFENVSKQRRSADHKARPAAKAFPAFEVFTKDLRDCHMAVRKLQEVLEAELGVKGANMAQRHEAKKYLPVISAPAEPNFSIRQAEKMKGKTVESVEYGFRKGHPDLHQSEVLIIRFTDGSILGIDTGSNVGNVCEEHSGLKPNEFHVDLALQWVPEKT